MHPILLQVHSRGITFVKYNREGDLIFSCSKDGIPMVWRTEDGERLGTFDGHRGAISAIDVTRDSKYCVTASADQTMKIWEVATGREIASVQHTGAVRSVAFNEGDTEIVTANDRFALDRPASVQVFPFDPATGTLTPEPRLQIVDPVNPRVNFTRVAWLPLNEGILAATEQGTLTVYDAVKGRALAELREHSDAITSLSFNADKTLMITSSVDTTAKLWDVASRRVLKTYKSGAPVNGAAISPIREHIFMGGGQQARDVTTTAAEEGKFETHIHHLVFGHELGRIRGHFGPINTLAIHPDGRSYASGGEDGYVRVHTLDADYYTLGDEENLDEPELTRALADGTFEQLEAEEAARQQEEAAERAAAAVEGK